jgi:hypothetical protein
MPQRDAPQLLLAVREALKAFPDPPSPQLLIDRSLARWRTEFYLMKANVERTLAHVSPNADPDGLEIVSTSVSLSGT